MIQFNTKTFLFPFLLTTLFISASVSPIFSQAEQNKVIIKKIIIDDEGNEQITEEVYEGEEATEWINENGNITISEDANGNVIEEDIDVIIFSDDENATHSEKEIQITIDKDHQVSPRRKHHRHPFLSKEDAFMRGFKMGGPQNTNFDMVTLKEGEAIPEAIIEKIKAMGLNPNEVKNALDQAEHSIRIVKEGSKDAVIQADKTPHFMGRNSGANTFMFKKGDCDLPNGNFNWNSNDGETHSFQFKSDGQLPEGIEKMLKEKGIDLNNMGNGQGKIKIITGDDLQNMDLNIELKEGDDMIKFFNIKGDGNFNIENLSKNADDLFKNLKIEMDGLEGFDCKDQLESFKSKMQTLHEDRPFLGVVFTSNSEDQTIRIEKVMENSAAAAAGIQAGDIIKKLDNKAMNSIADVINHIKTKKVGDALAIEVTRDGAVQTMQATLKKKENYSMGAFPRKPHFNHKYAKPHGFKSFQENFDCKVLCVTPMLGVEIENREDQIGVNVSGIFAGSGAEKSKLDDGAVILSFEGTEIKDVDQLANMVQSKSPGDQVKLRIQQNGKIKKIKAELSRKSDLDKYSGCDCETGEYRRDELIIIKEFSTNTPEESISETPIALEPFAPRNSLSLDQFNLFPNPNTGSFKVTFTAEELAPLTITIVDLSGKEVYREEVSEFNGNYNKELNITNQAPGVYFLNVQQGENIFSKRFVFNNAR